MTSGVNSQCSICNSAIYPANEENPWISKLNCNHEFHQLCMQNYYADHDTCPLDGRKITQIQNRDLWQETLAQQMRIANERWHDEMRASKRRDELAHRRMGSPW